MILDMIGLFLLSHLNMANHPASHDILRGPLPTTAGNGLLQQIPDSKPALETLDQAVPELMAKWNLPGGAIAITHDERLVFARGYGIADKSTGAPVQPNSLFRIGSVSKPVTAVATLKLAQEGKLDLEGKAFRILDHLQPAAKARVDPRIYEISIRQLLHHSGGWDPQMSSDPMGRFREAAQTLGIKLPVDAAGIIRYMIGRPLDYAPGTRHAYSNFGYCVLGRVIERASGQGYEAYVQEHILKPIGIKRMRTGRTLPGERYPGEVCYYTAEGVRLVPSALSDQRKLVEQPYGGYYLESMDSHGGWIASAIDLVRFLAAVDGREGHPDLLTPETESLMLARPQPPLWVGTPIYYAMGWNVRPLKKGLLFYHTGALAGSSLATVVCAPGGLSWAALFNSIPEKISEFNRFFMELDMVIGQATARVTEWPGYDLFADYDR